MGFGSSGIPLSMFSTRAPLRFGNRKLEGVLSVEGWNIDSEGFLDRLEPIIEREHDSKLAVTLLPFEKQHSARSAGPSQSLSSMLVALS